MKKIAFVFPGQGSQQVGMGRQIYEQYPEARSVFEQAGKSLGIDMVSLCFEGPEEELRKTVNAQPAILTVSIACLSVLKQHGYIPDVTAGHSLGEYSALVAAGSLDFQDAVQLVRHRGQYMQEAVPLGQGGMVAVMGLESEVIIRECAAVSKSGGVVEAVNLNSPGQVVIAGDNDSLNKAVETLKEKGARRCIPLPVSAPFHSSLMKPAGERLASELLAVEIKNPSLPVMANVTADYHASSEDIRQMLVRQVYSPVRWEECVRRMMADQVELFVEVGPGRVLSGLIKKIDGNYDVMNAEDPASLENVMARLKEITSQ